MSRRPRPTPLPQVNHALLIGSAAVLIALLAASLRQIQCRTCHGTLTELPAFVTITDPNDAATRRGLLNPFYDVMVGSQVLLAPNGYTLGAVQLVGGQIVQIGQVTGAQYTIPLVVGSACTQQADQQESRYCHKCHAYNRSNQD